MSKKNNLLVAASGTGGHIFPALAVSKSVELDWNIYWLGIKERLDANFVPKKYNLITLNIKTPKKNVFIFGANSVLARKFISIYFTKYNFNN